MDRLKALS
jgi:hypothetical protein